MKINFLKKFNEHDLFFENFNEIEVIEKHIYFLILKTIFE